MYFKKAVDDATSEWAQHHAKRFIDTKAKVRPGCRGAAAGRPLTNVLLRSACTVSLCLQFSRCHVRLKSHFFCGA